MSTVLGVDAGGTKTFAALVDETGGVVNFVIAAGLDPTRAEDAEAELDGFLLGLLPTDAVIPVAATVGLPFHGEVSAITRMQQHRVSQRLGTTARACNDVELAHTGAFADSDGVLVLAGTGSMAWARGPAGVARASGFGDLIGDEGSAFWIGQKAIAILSQEIDGRRTPSPFGTGLRETLGIGADGLIDWVYGQDNPRTGIASLARHASTLAAAGDADAGAILRDAAAELFKAGRAAAQAAGLGSNAPYSTAGSVFLDPIVAAELARLMNAQPVRGHLPPVGGAILDAARRAGWAIDQSWISRLDSELKQKGAL